MLHPGNEHDAIRLNTVALPQFGRRLSFPYTRIRLKFEDQLLEHHV